MVCAYCDSNIEIRPDSGICPYCGAPLPKDTPSWTSRVSTPPPPAPQIVYQVPPQVVYQVPLQPGINCCGRCNARNITVKKRGFSWGWGLFWFFMIPFIGIFLGFCGSNKLIYRCQSCGHKWKR